MPEPIAQSEHLAGAETGNCRLCGARVWKVTLNGTARRASLDHTPDPSGRGNLVCVAPAVVDYVRRGAESPAGEPLYTDHAATCRGRDEASRAGSPPGAKVLDDPQLGLFGAPEPFDREAEIERLSLKRGEVLRRLDAIRRDELVPIDAALKPLLDERDRMARGAYAAGANRPVDLRLRDRAVQLAAS